MSIGPTGNDPIIWPIKPPQGAGGQLYTKIIKELNEGNTSQAITDINAFANMCNQYSGPCLGSADSLCGLFSTYAGQLQSGEQTPSQVLTAIQNPQILGQVELVFGGGY